VRKSTASVFARANARRNVSVGGKKNNWQRLVEFNEHILEVESAWPRHADVKNHATMRVPRFV
jgi:hypothetical protein